MKKVIILLLLISSCFINSMKPHKGCETTIVITENKFFLVGDAIQVHCKDPGTRNTVQRYTFTKEPLQDESYLLQLIMLEPPAWILKHVFNTFGVKNKDNLLLNTLYIK